MMQIECPERGFECYKSSKKIVIPWWMETNEGFVEEAAFQLNLQ